MYSYCLVFSVEIYNNVINNRDEVINKRNSLLLFEKNVIKQFIKATKILHTTSVPNYDIHFCEKNCL